MLASALGWFKALSLAKKAGMIGATVVTGAVVSASPPPEPPQTDVLPAVQTQQVVETKTETETKSIAFKTIERDDDTLEKGKEVLDVKGKRGEKVITYEVTYTDGVESSRQKLSEEITQKPVNAVKLIGTKVAAAPAPSSQSQSPVKMSNSDICHAPGTTYYSRTTNFTPYNTLQACLDAGGRLPLR